MRANQNKSNTLKWFANIRVYLRSSAADFLPAVDVTDSLLLSEEFTGPRLSLGFTLLLQLLVDAPLVTEGIDKLAVARSPKHVSYRHVHCRPRRDGTRDEQIRIVDFERDASGSSAECLRSFQTAAFALIKLVGDEELMSVENYLAVQNLLSVRTHHRVSFLSAKDLLVEVDRSQTVVDNQMWNELILSMHVALLFA
jgi:hypothetical protein